MFHGLGRSATLTGHLGDAGGSRLHEHDAEPLLLQAAPAGPARHGEDVTCPVEAG